MELREVAVIGGGLAGLSAAVYLGRSRRDTLLIHSGHSMAKWEARVDNYLGFPDGIAGTTLLEFGLRQAARFHVDILADEIRSLRKKDDTFELRSLTRTYHARRVLIATGLTHLPPDIPGVKECLGKSLFFCKDCDAYRLQGLRIAIVGHNNEAAEYALAMLTYTPNVRIATHGRAPSWDETHDGWLNEYGIPVFRDPILAIDHDEGWLRAFCFAEDMEEVDAIFTTRGDVPHSGLAEGVGAAMDAQGQIIVDERFQTSVPGFYAAGCVTPANCQMITAAGQGASAAQAINRDLFFESLAQHRLVCAQYN